MSTSDGKKEADGKKKREKKRRRNQVFFSRVEERGGARKTPFYAAVASASSSGCVRRFFKRKEGTHKKRSVCSSYLSISPSERGERNAYQIHPQHPFLEKKKERCTHTSGSFTCGSPPKSVCVWVGHSTSGSFSVHIHHFSALQGFLNLPEKVWKKS